MSASAFMLEAGGLVPAAAVVEDVSTDVVSARSYPHAALGDRVVVRLSPAALSEADDLEMEVLGFSAGEDLGEVGRQKRRALGFPGWALVHDPDHARYALQVVKRFGKAARRVKSKPGFAKDDFDALATELSGAVPHFLPSFYEEAGRAYLAHCNQKYAGQMFEKARDAERVYGLEVDEDLRRESFLEFALAGGVAIKSMSNYARDLGTAADPLAAYQQFRKLCVGRTLGGLPPWAGMAAALRKLARRAGLDKATEDRALIDEIIEAPALKKAARGFWNQYSKAIAAACADAPALRAHLLDLFAESGGWRNKLKADWLVWLEEWGCMALLDGDVPEDALPAGGLASWLGRLLDYVWSWRRASSAQTRLLSWVARAAPRLKASGSRLRVVASHRMVHLDLADLALEHGLDIELSDNARLNLQTWTSGAELEGCGRDPVHAVAHPQLGPLLADATGDSIGDGDFDRLSHGMQGFLAAKRAWLDGRLSTLEGGGVGSVRVSVAELKDKLSAGLMADCGAEYLERLAAVRTVGALENSLKWGIPDELGWPALEAAVTEMGGADYETFVCFPTVVLANAVKVVAVGPEGILGRQDLQLGARQNIDLVQFVGGRFLVFATDTTTYDRYGFWAGVPDSRFSRSGYHYNQAHLNAFVLDDGAVVGGKQAVSVGDSVWPSPEHLFFDGQTAWRPVPKPPHGRTWSEFDPRTGEVGRASLPAFLEDYAQEGSQVMVAASRLLPWKGDTPLGAKDGLVGWRVRVRDTEHPLGPSRPGAEAEGVDGRRLEATTHDGLPWGMLSLPGLQEHVLVDFSSSWRGMGTTAFRSPDGRSISAHIGTDDLRMECFGQATVLPPIFLHAYTPRDPRASQALRRVLSQRVLGWFDAAHAVWTAPEGELKQALLAAMKAVDITADRRLRRGIGGLATLAAKAQVELDQLVDSLRPGEGAEVDIGLLTDSAVTEALGVLVDTSWSRDGHLGRAIQATVAALDAGVGDSANLASRVLWWPLVGRQRALAVLASLETTSDEHRAVLLQLLDLLASTPFVGTERGRYRVLRGTVTRDRLKALRSRPVFRHKESVFVAGRLGGYHHNDQVPLVLVERVGARGPQVPAFLSLSSTRTFSDGWGTAEDVAALRARLQAHGPVAVPDPSSYVQHTGRPRAEALLVLSGMPRIEKYETNYLPKALRLQLGLKVAEADAARGPLRALRTEQRLRLYSGGFDEVSELFDGGWVQRLADCWVAAHGRSVVLEEDTLAAVPKATTKVLGNGLRKALELFLVPGESAALLADPTPRWTKEGLVAGTTGATFSVGVLERVVELLPWVCTALPAGDPVRAGAEKVLGLARARLLSGKLFVGLGSSYHYGDESPDEAFDAVGGELKHDGRVRDRGLWLAARVDRRIDLYFRPDKVRSMDDIAVLGQLHSNSYSKGFPHTVLLMSPQFERLVQPTPTEAGRYDADPRQSCPHLVDTVQARHGLSEDAATLYLQTLALVDCTTKNVRLWNDWTASRYKKACTELLGKDGLVLEARRARAQRKIFVPGGWLAQRAPNLPLERWKMPLYGLEIPEGTTQAAGPYATFLPIVPLPELFGMAWARVEAGDGPRYEEV